MKNSDYLARIYRSWAERMAANPDKSIEDLRDLFEEWHKATLEPERVSYRSDTIGGVSSIRVLPENANPEKVMLYAHGGGFAVGSAASHRKLAAHLAKALGITAVVFDYRRAPEHPFPAQLVDTIAVYKELLDQGFSPKNIVISGDSAGGNLAISATLKLRADGLPMPTAVIAMSPWLDMEHTGITLETNKCNDILINREILQGMSEMFLGKAGSPDNPFCNPLKADFNDFPPLYINAGSSEALLDNSQNLKKIAEKSGVDVSLSIVNDMQHVFPMMAGRSDHADKEISRIAAWFKNIDVR